jgi:porin
MNFTRGVKGATIPVELAWKPKLAAFNGLPGEYKVGALYSTAEANAPTLYSPGKPLKAASFGFHASSTGMVAPFTLFISKTAGKVHDGKQSFWINAQQQLTNNGQDPKRGLYQNQSNHLDGYQMVPYTKEQAVAYFEQKLLPYHFRRSE